MSVLELNVKEGGDYFVDIIYFYPVNLGKS